LACRHSVWVGAEFVETECLSETHRCGNVRNQNIDSSRVSRIESERTEEDDSLQERIRRGGSAILGEERETMRLVLT